MRTFVYTLAGVLLLLFVTYDVYSTILDARGRAGPISEALNRNLWRIWRFVGLRFSRQRRHKWLNQVGPLLLPILIVVYILLLITAFALIYYPHLSVSFYFAHEIEGVTFFESFYYSGVTLTTVGYGDITPRSVSMRAVTMVEGASGLAVISLAVTYLITIYGALERRRIVALSVYHPAGQGADVAGLISYHFVNGRFQGLEAMLRDAARDVQELLESHVEHPIIHYFHPLEVYKSFPRILFLLLETPTVIHACLDENEYADICQHPAIKNVESSARHVLDDLVAALDLERRATQRIGESDAEEARRWELRFKQTRRSLQQAGIKTRKDVEGSWLAYRAKRVEWEALLDRFALHLGYDWDEVTGDGDLDYAADEEKKEPREDEQGKPTSSKAPGR